MKKHQTWIALFLTAVFSLSMTATILAEPLSAEGLEGAEISSATDLAESNPETEPTESNEVSAPEQEDVQSPSAVESEEVESSPSLESTPSPESTVSAEPELPSEPTVLEEEVLPSEAEEVSSAVSDPLTATRTAKPIPYGKTAGAYAKQAESILNRSAFSDLMNLFPHGLIKDEEEDLPIYQYQDYIYLLIEKQALLVAYLGSEPEITLPETINGAPVISVLSTFLMDNQDVASITIPAGITDLQPGCFFSPTLTVSEIKVDDANPTFQSIDGVLFDKSGGALIAYPAGSSAGTYTLPSGTKQIQEAAFVGAGIVHVVLPEGVRLIDEMGFLGSLLRTIDLPQSLEAIGQDAFRSSMLSSITLPKSLTYLGAGAFADTRLTSIQVESENPRFASEDGVLYDKAKTKIEEYPCRKQTGNYVVPATVKGLTARSFASNRYLKTLSLQKNSVLDLVATQAFEACVNLTSVDLSATKSLTMIEEEAFLDCQKLASVKLPNGLLDIRAGAFSGCSLTSIQLPESLRWLREESFIDNPIHTLHIPKNVSEFVECGILGTFYDADDENAKPIPFKLTIDPANPHFKLVKEVLFNGDKKTLLWYPDHLTATSYTIPDHVTQIANYAIFNLYLTTLNIPKSVTKIDEAAIWGEELLVYGFKGSAAEAYCNDPEEELAFSYPALSLSHTKATLAKGKTTQLSAKLSPKLSGDAVRFQSSNSKVAKVSSTGLITAVSTGTATITATAASGNVKKCTVTVSGSAAVTLKASANGINSAKLSWTAASGASGYEVYQATSKTGTYKKVYSGTARSYIKTQLTSNKTYYYKVRSFVKSGGKTQYSAYSSIASAKPLLVNKVAGTKTLNIRKKPSNTGGIVGTYKQGDSVAVKAVSGKWLQTGKGWISSKYVSSKTAVVTGTTTLNVRTSPTTGRIVKALKKGSKVTVYAEKSGWFLTNQGGWVSGKYLR